MCSKSTSVELKQTPQMKQQYIANFPTFKYTFKLMMRVNKISHYKTVPGICTHIHRITIIHTHRRYNIHINKYIYGEHNTRTIEHVVSMSGAVWYSYNIPIHDTCTMGCYRYATYEYFMQWIYAVWHIVCSLWQAWASTNAYTHTQQCGTESRFILFQILYCVCCIVS